MDVVKFIIESELINAKRKLTTMSDIQDKLIKIFKNPKVQAELSISSGMIAISHPVSAAVVNAFKEAATLSDEIRFSYLLKGLASGLNQETFTIDLLNYVKASEDNASHVASSLRKAVLTDSPIVCTLMGRIIADHVAEKRKYDKSDIIVVHALESATDDDLMCFRKMIKTASDNGDIAVSDEYNDCAEWCVNNRLCKESKGTYNEETKSLTLFPGIIVCEPAERLSKYLYEIKGIFSWNS